MTYADEIGPILREGMRAKWIVDVTRLPQMPEWLRQNTGTTCPTCTGTGGVMVSLNQARPGEILHLMAAPCPRCGGRGEIAYVCAN